VSDGASAIAGPGLLAQIADLELVARIIVEGLVSGLHRSPFHGYSAEFSQYRHYRPGDDLKYVDWKLLARTDRLYTKQFRETTNMSAQLVVDTSASMTFTGDVPGAPDKLRYAIVCAAALAHVVSGQGDAVGLLAARAGAPQFVPPRGGRQHLRRILSALAALAPRGSWSAAETIRSAAARLTRRGVLLVFSDFYEDGEADEERTFVELRRASRMGHEIVVFQIMSRAEIDFPYRTDLEFEDVETGRAVSLNAALARAGYRDAVAAFLERCRRRASTEGFQYTLVVTDTPPALALRTFFLGRRAAV
jgi:uncharacterized protein (DUF58 family)